MATWAWIVIIVAVLAVVAIAAALAMRQRRTARLRQRFGGEYERTVESREDRRAAESELRDREKQRAQLDIRPLGEASRARYAAEWRVLQERFVDEPADAASSADVLVHTVMAERGYPVGDFSAQSDLVSVDYPEIAEDYRVAHAICERARTQQASTEDLREALLRYRSLFGELLRDGADTANTDAASANGTARVTPDATAPATNAESVPAQRGASQGPTDMETGDDSR